MPKFNYQIKKRGRKESEITKKKKQTVYLSWRHFLSSFFCLYYLEGVDITLSFFLIQFFLLL